MGGGGKVKKPKDPPKETDPEVQEAIKKERELSARRRGRRSTMITGSMGLASNEERRTMLG
jgi:hypothetical protein